MKAKIGNIVRMGPFPNMSPRKINSKNHPSGKYGKIISERFGRYNVSWSNGTYWDNCNMGEDIIEIPNKERCEVIYINNHFHICSKYLIGGTILTSRKDLYLKQDQYKIDKFFNRFKNYYSSFKFVDCYYKNTSLSELWLKELELRTPIINGDEPNCLSFLVTNLGLIDKIKVKC